MKYIQPILIVIALVCLLQVASAAPKMYIEPSDSLVANGSTFTVDVKVDPLESEVTTAMYTLRFDNTHLRAISQTQGAFLSQGGEETKLDKNAGIDNTAGTVSYGEYIIAEPDENHFGVYSPGILTSITFEAICDDGAGNLNITNPKLAVVTGRPDNIFVTYLDASDIDVFNGTFTVYKLGDINSDGNITSSDALIALRMAVRGEYSKVADVNNDGSVTSLDALMILSSITMAVADPVMTVSQQPVGAGLNDTFTAEVTVNPAGSEIYATSYRLCFNSTILKAIDQTQEDFLSQGGAETYEVVNTINNTAGRIEYGETRLGDPDVAGYATEPGVLASITFEVIGDGISTLTLSNVNYVKPEDLTEPEPTDDRICSNISYHGSTCCDNYIEIKR